jgi:hypothetical protein
MSRNKKTLSRPSAPENRARRSRGIRKNAFFRCALRVALQVGSIISLCREAYKRWRKYNP